jgi:hypothetical protein
MNPRFAAGIVATIVIGLTLDAQGERWAQPLVNVVAWAMFAGLLAASDRQDRVAYLSCLLLATGGEVFLALVWGVYDYRLGNLPLFVPPGHVLLYALGRWIADRIPFTASGLACIVVLALAAILATWGIDQLSAPLAVHEVRAGPEAVRSDVRSGARNGSSRDRTGQLDLARTCALVRVVHTESAVCGGCFLLRA